MKSTGTKATMVAFLLLAAVPAGADWQPGDGHKMHFPQLPDPNGWDVDFMTAGLGARKGLADDWMCSNSGPVSDVHFWFSSRGDEGPFEIDEIYVRIYEDIPADQSPTGYAVPGDILWDRAFSVGEFDFRTWGQGDQGWFEPWTEPVVIPHDHSLIYQANIMDIPDPFFQQEGTIYWLGVGVNAGWTIPPQTPAGLGWKSSLDHWGDPAVWDYGPAVDPVFWRQLADPDTGGPLHLAFVIVPEPSTVAMLLAVGATGLLAMICRWRKRFRSKAIT